MNRRIALLALAALVLVAGCSSSGSQAPETLTVYSGRTKNLIGPLMDRFQQQTGIKVEVQYGDSAELALKIAEEGERSPADVFFSQSPGATGFLATQGRLATIDRSLLDKVDARFRAADGRWVGITGRQRVLVYNSKLVPARDLPRSVLELTAPRWSGKVALAPGNGSFQDFVTAMRALQGDQAAQDWLKGMAANKARSYANNNAIVEAVGRGEVPVGLVNHYYNYRFVKEHPGQPSRNHQFAGDDVGSLVIPSTVSVLAGSERGEAARRLIEFLLSSESQRYFSDETFEYPLAGGVPAAPGLPPLASLHTPAFDFDRLGGGLKRTVELIRASGLEGV